MDVLVKAAVSLRKTPEELIEHVAHGRFTVDKTTEEEFVRHVFRRYCQFRVIPDWLKDYCVALIGDGQMVLPFSEPH